MDNLDFAGNLGELGGVRVKRIGIMKAFEEWWYNEDDNFYTPEGAEYLAAKASWRAALEWVLTMKTEDDYASSPVYGKSYHLPEWAIEEIEEELETNFERKQK